MPIRNAARLLAAAGLAAAALGAGPAMARSGCNGVVNILRWSCAPWDNNNGAQYPYYKKTTVQVTPKRIEKVGNALMAVTADGQKLMIAQQDLARAQLISDRGGSVVSNDGHSFAVLTGQ